MKTLFPLATSILVPLLITSPMRGAMPSAEPGAVPQIRISVVEREAPSVTAGSTAVKGFTVLVADAAGAPVSDSAVVFRFPDDGPSGSFADATHSAIVYTSADGLARISGIKWSDKPGPVAIKVLATKGDARAGIMLMEMLTAAATEQPPAGLPAPVTAPVQQQPAAPAVAAPQTATAAVKPVLPRPTDAPSTVAAEPHSIAEEPEVSVTNGKTVDTASHSSHKKWIILAAIVAAAAGAGIAMGTKGKSSSTASTSGVTVGTPTVSVGQP